MILFPKYARTIIRDQTKSCFSPPKMYKIFGALFFLSLKTDFTCRASFCIVGKKIRIFANTKNIILLIPVGTKIKTGPLPDNEAKEKKQVKFHAEEVCSLRLCNS